MSATEELKIELTAQNKATKEIQEVQKSVGKLDTVTQQAKATFTDLKAISIGVGAGLLALKGAYEVVVAPTIAYANQVQNLSRLVGAGAEETSRLIQVSDDLFISYESLTAGLSAAVRKGIDPSVASLGRLSDKYLTLNPGLERSKFLMDNFGRSGMDMAKLMEQGSAKINELNTSVDKNLVLTDLSIKQIELYNKQVDNLKDTFQGLTVKIGGDAIPVLSELLKMVQEKKWQTAIGLGPIGWITAFINALDRAKKSSQELQAEIDKTASKSSKIQSINNAHKYNPGDEGYSAQDATRGWSGRAVGGPVVAGVPYIVNEGQPEVFVPPVSGKMQPLSSSSGNTVINVTLEYNTMLSMADKKDLENALYPAVLEGIRKAQRDGRLK